MCYKYLWDSLVDDKFPVEFFFDFFSLNPNYMLSSEIRENMAKSGIASEVRIALKKKKRTLNKSLTFLAHVIMVDTMVTVGDLSVYTPHNLYTIE